MEQQQWEAPVHRSLVRPMLVMGGERELVMMLGMIAGIFIVSFFQVWAAISGILMWVIGIFFLQRMGEKDPRLSKVFIRSLKYSRKSVLPSAGTPFAQPSTGRE